MNIFQQDHQVMIDNLVIWLTTNGVSIVVAILIFIIGKMAANKITKVAKLLMLKGKVEETLVEFLCHILYYMMLAAVVIAALGQMGINITSFLAVLGAAGLAVGLALKDSLSNFAAGVMLILFRFYKKDDVVTVAGNTGKVTAINVFNTVLATADNQVIIVPNGAILGGTIVNITANDTRRVDMVVGIGYGDDIPKAKATLEQILADNPLVLKDPAPQVAVAELGASSVDFVVRPWCKTSDYWDVKFGLTQTIKMTFDEKSISFPFPQTDVHLYKEN